MEQLYIHYGSDHFDKNKFIKIKNCAIPWVKPEKYTGMWGSPINAHYGWSDWCRDTDFDVYKLDKHFTFTLKENSKFLYVRNDNELQDLKLLHCFDRPYLKDPYHPAERYCMNFEKLRDCFGYDAMEVHITTDNIYVGLYGWDCDSILILNPDCVIERN